MEAIGVVLIVLIIIGLIVSSAAEHRESEREHITNLIVDGVEYDARTAERIWNRRETIAIERDHDYHCDETLCRKADGSFFLFENLNYVGWPTSARPMSPEEARSWAERNMPAKEFRRAFGASI